MKENFWSLPDIEDASAVCLQDLSYQCAVLEEELRAVAEALPDAQRAVIEDYIAFRDTKEVESVKAALCFNERQAKKAKSKTDFTPL